MVKISRKSIKVYQEKKKYHVVTVYVNIIKAGFLLFQGISSSSHDSGINIIGQYTCNQYETIIKSANQNILEEKKWVQVDQFRNSYAKKSQEPGTKPTHNLPVLLILCTSVLSALVFGICNCSHFIVSLVFCTYKSILILKIQQFFTCILFYL